MSATASSPPPHSLATETSHHLSYLDWDPTSPSSSQRFLTSLRLAMVGHGFFYLFHTPLSHPTRRDAMYDVTTRFFRLLLSSRLRILIDHSPHFRGYTPFRDEMTQAKHDVRDQVDFASHVEPLPRTEGEKRGEQGACWKNLFGPNQYVEEHEVPHFEASVNDWFHLAQQVGASLHGRLVSTHARFQPYLARRG